MTNKKVNIEDHGAFVIIKNPHDPALAHGAGYEKGAFSAKIETVGGRDFIIISKGLGPQSFLITSFPHDHFEEAQASAVDTLSVIMRKLTFPLKIAC